MRGQKFQLFLQTLIPSLPRPSPPNSQPSSPSTLPSSSHLLHHMRSEYQAESTWAEIRIQSYRISDRAIALATTSRTTTTGLVSQIRHYAARRCRGPLQWPWFGGEDNKPFLVNGHGLSDLGMIHTPAMTKVPPRDKAAPVPPRQIK